MYLVVFKEIKDENIVIQCGGEVVRDFKNLPYIYGVEADERAANCLSEHPGIMSIEKDVVEYEESQKVSYALDMLSSNTYREHGLTGKGVKIAVFDNGCQYHEDLKISGGFNAVNPDEPYMAAIGDHGTHCAGIINMQDNDKGYLGIAPEAELYIVKMDDNKGGGLLLSAQIEGLSWCIDNDIDIMSMSVSGINDYTSRKEAFRSAAEDHGIICVAAAGNHQGNVPLDERTIRFPAKYPFVVGVGNLNENMERRYSSSTGFGLDLMAPGTNIMSTITDLENEISKEYGSMTGTSMATPFVAGVFALYKQRFPNLGREELIKKVKGSALYLGDERIFGAGLIRPPQELLVGSSHERYYVRDLKGNEYSLQATVTHNFELNGNQSVEFAVLPTKVNKAFISDIGEMWEVIDDRGVVHKIVHAKQKGAGSYKREYIPGSEEGTFFITPVQTIEQDGKPAEIKKSTQLTVEVKAIPLFFDKMDNSRIYEEFNEHMTAHKAFTRIFDGMPFNFVLVDHFEAVDWEGFGAGESRLETFKRALKRYKCEFRLSGNTVYLERQVGRDTSIMYRHKLNASNIVKEIDAGEYYTYAKGYGDYGDGEGGGEWQDAKLIVEYTSPLAKIPGIGKRDAPPIKDGRVTSESTMEKSLETLVKESLKVSVSADIHDLTKQGYPIAISAVGDRVFLIDPRINTDEEVRVVNQSITKDWRGKITALNITFGSEGLSKRHQSNLTTAAKQINELVEGRRKLPHSALDDAVRSATKALKAAETELKFTNNGILSVDKKDPNLLTLLNSAGFGVSNDGGNTFGQAITGKGIVADYITSGTLRSIVIEAIEMYGSRIEGTEIYSSEFFQESGDKEIQIREGSVYSYYKDYLAMRFGQYKLDFYNRSGDRIGYFGTTALTGEEESSGLSMIVDRDYFSIAVPSKDGNYASSFRTSSSRRSTIVSGAYATGADGSELGLFANANRTFGDSRTDQPAIILEEGYEKNDVRAYFGGINRREGATFEIKWNKDDESSSTRFRATNKGVELFGDVKANGNTLYENGTGTYDLYKINALRANGIGTTDSKNFYIATRDDGEVIATGYSGFNDGNPVYRGFRGSAFNQASSRRLKTHINPLSESGLGVVNDLLIVDYLMKEDVENGIYDNRKVGLIAEDSAPVSSSNLDSIDMYRLTSYNTKAIQELDEKIEGNNNKDITRFRGKYRTYKQRRARRSA